MFLSLDGTFNEQKFSDLGLSLVRVDGGLLKRNLSLNRTVNKETVKYKNTPNFYGVENSSTTFPLTFAKITDDDTVLTYDDRVSIHRFFFPDDQPHDLISDDFPGIRFVGHFVSTESFDNGLGEGYFTLNFEMMYPYALSNIMYSEFDLSDNTSGTIIEIPNNSNILPLYTPDIIEFTLIGDSTSFKWTNLTNAGYECEFTGLNLLETVSVNSRNEVISDTGISRIDKFNFGFRALELAYGINRILITGKCILRIKTSYPMAMI